MGKSILGCISESIYLFTYSDEVNATLGRLTRRVDKVISVAARKGFNYRLEHCKESVELLFTIRNLCEAFGITMDELEPLPSRVDLPQNPEADEMRTNTFYPQYNDMCVGTSDDIAISHMSASPLNQRPGVIPRGTVRIVLMELERRGLSPITEVLTPPESETNEGMYTNDSAAGGQFSVVPEHETDLTTLVAIPDITQPPESIPDPSHGDRPITPTVNLIRATPQNSQEAGLPVLVPLQPTPPNVTMQPALHPIPDLPHPEPMCPDQTPAGSPTDLPPIPELTSSDAAVSEPPVAYAAVPKPAVPDPTVPEPAGPKASVPVPASGAGVTAADTAVPEPPVSQPPVPEPLAHVPDPTIAEDTSHPLASRKRKRAGMASLTHTRPIHESLGVPRSSAIRTRSASLAAHPRTRSASCSRSVSCSRGEKCKAENSGDDWESNKRCRAWRVLFFLSVFDFLMSHNFSACLNK